MLALSIALIGIGLLFNAFRKERDRRYGFDFCLSWVALCGLCWCAEPVVLTDMSDSLKASSLENERRLVRMEQRTFVHSTIFGLSAVGAFGSARIIANFELPPK